MEGFLNMKSGGHFLPLNLPSRQLANGDVSRYYVVDASGQKVIVVAETAAEAFKMSGLPNPVRIRREMLSKQALFEEGMFVDHARPDDLDTIESSLPPIREEAVAAAAALTGSEIQPEIAPESEPEAEIPADLEGKMVAEISIPEDAEQENSEPPLSEDDIARLLNE